MLIRVGNKTYNLVNCNLSNSCMCNFAKKRAYVTRAFQHARPNVSDRERKSNFCERIVHTVISVFSVLQKELQRNPCFREIREK